MPEGGALSTLFYTLLAAFVGAILIKVKDNLLPRGTPLTDGVYRAVTFLGWIYVVLCGLGIALIGFFRIRQMLLEFPVPA